MKKYRVRYTNALGGGVKDCTVQAYDEDGATAAFHASRYGKTRGARVLVVSIAS